MSRNVRLCRIQRRAGALVLSILAAAVLLLSAPAPVRAAGRLAAAQATTTTAPNDLQRRFEELDQKVDNLQTLAVFIIGPIAVLIGILALGGAFGVVFSVRDQRRISQLHELSVASETASQRRSEESYSTFLDASQKTLTLVNDTLKLAKDASQRAAETMQLKAGRNLTSIDDQAQELLDRVYIGGDFKKLVEEPSLRGQLEAIADELAAIEGYLVLQDIPLKPACLFVKGMARHLKHDAHGALRTLREAVHNAKTRDLRSLGEYWLAYIYNNLGQYRDAAEVFRRAHEDVRAGSPPAFELDRIVLESEFFERADALDGLPVEERPVDTADRLDRMRQTVDGLRELADSIDSDRFDRVARRIAATRANVLTWAANLEREDEDARRDLDRSDCLREALQLYEQAGRGLFARFGALESRYYLEGATDRDGYAEVERMAMDEQRTRTEPRNTANLQETILIVRYRQTEGTDDANEALREAYGKVQAALGAVDEETTVFSQMQKRNLRRDDFTAEVSRFYERARRPKPKEVVLPEGTPPQLDGAGHDRG
jgi:tetratricopeptide (TPR) repeat protein